MPWGDPRLEAGGSIYLAHILMSARVSENVAILNLVDAVIEPTTTLANDL